jgi:hypothetical protein
VEDQVARYLTHQRVLHTVPYEADDVADIVYQRSPSGSTSR